MSFCKNLICKTVTRLNEVLYKNVLLVQKPSQTIFKCSKLTQYIHIHKYIISVTLEHDEKQDYKLKKQKNPDLIHKQANIPFAAKILLLSDFVNIDTNTLRD